MFYIDLFIKYSAFILHGALQISASNIYYLAKYLNPSIALWVSDIVQVKEIMTVLLEGSSVTGLLQPLTNIFSHHQRKTISFQIKIKLQNNQLLDSHHALYRVQVVWEWVQERHCLTGVYWPTITSSPAQRSGETQIRNWSPATMLFWTSGCGTFGTRYHQTNWLWKRQ